MCIRDSFNIGADATFLNGNLFLSVDYFDKKTSNILLTPEVSSIYGGSAAKENAGEMKNRGWELTINYKLNSGDFQHNFNFNVSDSKNKVTDFGGKERIDQNEQLYTLIREGQPLGSYFGYKTDGLDVYKRQRHCLCRVGISSCCQFFIGYLGNRVCRFGPKLFTRITRDNDFIERL